MEIDLQEQSGNIFTADTPYGKYPPSGLNRVNERYKRIVTANIDHVAGKRILDLAAHDGRWTWAALKSGASYVEAVEGRPELVAAANEALASYPKETFRFRQGDIFDYLEEIRRTHVGRFDTILCLGIFYHIAEHFRLLQLMTGLQPSAIILDTALINTPEPKITFQPEATESKLNAIPGDAEDECALVGTMSRGLLKQWCDLNGWQVTYIPWRRQDISDTASLHDYLAAGQQERARFTCLLTPMSADERSQARVAIIRKAQALAPGQAKGRRPAAAQ
jgi:hypothetical protein